MRSNSRVQGSSGGGTASAVGGSAPVNAPSASSIRPSEERTSASPTIKGFFTRVEDSTHALRLSLSLPSNFATHPSVLDALNKSLAAKQTKDANGASLGGGVGGASSILGFGFSAIAGLNPAGVSGAAQFGARHNHSGEAPTTIGPNLSANSAGHHSSLASTIDHHEWSLIEDRLIVKLDDARSDLLSGYNMQHRLDPVHFPKVLTDDAVLRGRAHELKELATQRLRFLRSLPEEDVAIFAEELRKSNNSAQPQFGSGVFGSNSDNSDFASNGNAFASSVFDAKGPSTGPAASASGRRKSTRGGARGLASSTLGASTRLTGGHHVQQAKSRDDDDMVIRCSSREEATETEILCSSKDILRFSPFLSDLYKQQSDGAGSMAVVGLRHVTLSERDPMWNSVQNMHAVFSADNVLRFKAFCERPSVFDELETATNKATAALRQQDANWNHFVSVMSASQKAHLKHLADRTAVHEEIITAQLNACLEADIAAIRAVYEAHIDAEVKKMRKRAEKETKRIEAFFAKEIEFLKAMRDCYSEPESVDLADDAAATEAKIEDAFAPQSIPRLLMLSDVLLCTELRSACIKRISQRFVDHQYMNNPELSSDLLRANTLRELTASLSDENLIVAHQRGRHAQNGIPSTFVAEEYESRRLARLTEFRSMPTDELRDLSLALTDMVAATAKSPKSATSSGGSAGTKKKLRRRDADDSNVNDGDDGDDVRSNAAVADGLIKASASPIAQYLPWRDEILAVLSERQKRQYSTTNVAAIRIISASQPYGELDSKRRAFELHASYRYATVEGCGAVRCGESTHKVYFECRIATADRRNTVSMYVGWNILGRSIARHRSSQGTSIATNENMSQAAKRRQAANAPLAGIDGPIPQDPGSAAPFTAASGSGASSAAWGTSSFTIVGVTPVGEEGDLYGVCLTDEGIVYADGVPHECGIGFEPGDVIGVGLDCLSGAVSFYKNGGAIPSPHNVTLSVPTRICAVVPSLTAYSAAPTNLASGISHPQDGGSNAEHVVVVAQAVSAVKARVEFAFEGGFAHQVPQGFTAFARHAVPALSLCHSS